MSSKTRKCSKCSRNRSARFFSGPRGRICSDCSKKSRSKSTHEARVQEVYGLKAGEWDKLFEAQEGRCWICGGIRRQRLSVDHCHKTGVVRGLACRNCNGRLLTAARDNPEILRRAAEYLERRPATEIVGIRLHIDFRKDSD